MQQPTTITLNKKKNQDNNLTNQNNSQSNSDNLQLTSMPRSALKHSSAGFHYKLPQNNSENFEFLPVVKVS